MDSLKLNSKGPVNYKQELTTTSQGSILILSWTHLKDELTLQENVILLKLVKNKEVLARNGGGKERK